jgi:anti-sigma-K factor RskA
MPTTPVDDHTQEFEQLAGLSALAALEGDELERFEAHAAHCERCRVMVRLDREALAKLSLAAPEMDPSPGFKERLLQRASEELAERAQPAPPPIPIRPPGNVIPIWRRGSPWLNAIAAVLVVAAVSFGAYTYENQPVAMIQMTGQEPGSGTVVVRRSGAAQVELRGVPDPGPGFIYEAWVIPTGQQPIAAGVASSGNATIPLDHDPRGSTVAITREHTRVDAPTSTPLMAGEVRL